MHSQIEWVREANHWHVFWGCPVIRPFWTEFQRSINTIFGANLPLEFTTLFLGHANFRTGRSDEYLFGVLISACRKVFTRHWLLPEAPTIKEWIDIVIDIYNMERITYSLRLQKERFIEHWAKWVRYVLPLRPDFVMARID